jgi:DNA-binding PadR family transcriptional regulator
MREDAPHAATFGWFLEPALLILVSLTDGPKHGYAMMEDIERLGGGRLGPGTLYGALARLERDGWIVPLPSDDRRRPYQLTAAGAAIAREQLHHLHALVATGLARLAQS